MRFMAGAHAEYVLTITCPDRPGIVFSVATFLVHSSANILESQQYDDRHEDRFFMRVLFEVYDEAMTLERLRAAFSPVAAASQMSWQMWSADAKYRTLVMVSREGHCLNDLLFRQRASAQLPDRDPARCSSNHTGSRRGWPKFYGVPFEHRAGRRSPSSKSDFEASHSCRWPSIEYDIELVVLARYMQILSRRGVCAALGGRAINIHHSFLPELQGGERPYQPGPRPRRQARSAPPRTSSASDLDEGPIIEQDVTRVDHSLDGAGLVAAGRDVEMQVLSRAVRWHAQTRVLLNGNRTVVFR